MLVILSVSHELQLRWKLHSIILIKEDSFSEQYPERKEWVILTDLCIKNAISLYTCIQENRWSSQFIFKHEKEKQFKKKKKKKHSCGHCVHIVNN